MTPTVLQHFFIYFLSLYFDSVFCDFVLFCSLSCLFYLFHLLICYFVFMCSLASALFYCFTLVVFKVLKKWSGVEKKENPLPGSNLSTINQTDNCWWPMRHMNQLQYLNYTQWNPNCLNSGWIFTTSCLFAPEKKRKPTRYGGRLGCCRWVCGKMKSTTYRLQNLISHIVLLEWKQRCSWQQITTTTEGVRKSLELCKTPYCRGGLSIGFVGGYSVAVTVRVRNHMIQRSLFTSNNMIL